MNDSFDLILGQIFSDLTYLDKVELGSPEYFLYLSFYPHHCIKVATNIYDTS